jgi:hypothetical protein
VFRMDVAKVDRDVACVASVLKECCKFVQNASSVLNVCCKHFLSGCCTCFTPMLQDYDRNVSVVSVLCCNKCFHVTICKYFIWILHIFSHTCCNRMF